MGKWTKRILLLAVLMIAVGFIMIQTGRISGGAEYLKQVDLDYFDKEQKEAKTVTKKEELEEFVNAEIDFHDFDLKILPSKDDAFHLSYSYNGKNDTLTYEVKDKTLYLKESGGNSAERQVWIHVDDLKYGLIPIFTNGTEYEANVAYLSVPQNVMLRQMNIQMDDGDLFLENVKAQSADISGVDGDVILENTQIANAKITEKDGDIIITMSDRCLAGLDLDLYSKDGDVSVEGIEGNHTMNEDEEEQRFMRKSEEGKRILNAETADGDVVLSKKN